MKKTLYVIVGIVLIRIILAFIFPIIPGRISKDDLINRMPYMATWTQLYYKVPPLETNTGTVYSKYEKLPEVSLWNVSYIDYFALKTSNKVYLHGEQIQGADASTFVSLPKSIYGTVNTDELQKQNAEFFGGYYDKNNLYKGAHVYPLNGMTPIEKMREVSKK